MEYVTRADLRAVFLHGVAVLPHPTDSVGGLVGGLFDNHPRILTGIVMGPVRIGVDRREHAPGDTAGGWEDVVEVSCRAVKTVAVVTGPWAESPGVEFAINPPGPGWFRLRVHARNRDLEFDGVASGPHEEYLLVTWPADPAAPAVLSAGSALAQSMAAQSLVPIPPTRPSTVARAAGFTESAADAALRAEAQANLLRIARWRSQP